MMRDNALFASGLLHQEFGGEPVRPYQPAGLWKALANQIGENRYRPGRGHDLYRRSLYTYWKRTIPPPSMLTFDAPERTICTVERQATATPLQSLVLLNDPQYVEAARVLAERLLEDTVLDDHARITRAFRLFYVSPPNRRGTCQPSSATCCAARSIWHGAGPRCKPGARRQPAPKGEGRKCHAGGMDCGSQYNHEPG